MRLLLDTHAFLWWLEDPRRLAEPAWLAIADPANFAFVSAAVIWEIAIKRALGKLDAPDDAVGMIAANRFTPLAVTVEHAAAVSQLPPHHRDPFDRILIAQALEEGLILVSRDAKIVQYDVPHLLA